LAWASSISFLLCPSGTCINQMRMHALHACVLSLSRCYRPYNLLVMQPEQTYAVHIHPCLCQCSYLDHTSTAGWESGNAGAGAAREVPEPSNQTWNMIPRSGCNRIRVLAKAAHVRPTKLLRCHITELFAIIIPPTSSFAVLLLRH
jgi:hypothetical protein